MFVKICGMNSAEAIAAAVEAGADAVGFAATSVEVVPGVLTQNCPAPFALTRCYSRARFDRHDTLWGARLAFEHRFGDSPLVYASVARGARIAVSSATPHTVR